MNAATAEITTVLDQRHGIGASGTPGLHDHQPDPAALHGGLDQTLLTVLLAGIASISLSWAASGS